MLRGGHLDKARRERAVEVIERNARVQFHLIEDLLDVSRIVTGKLRLTVQRLDPAAVVTAAVESIRPAADAKRDRRRSISQRCRRYQDITCHIPASTP